MSLTGLCNCECDDGDNGGGGGDVTLQEVEDLIAANNALDPPANAAIIEDLIQQEIIDQNLSDVVVATAGGGSSLVGATTIVPQPGGNGTVKTITIRSLNSQDNSLVLENGSLSTPTTNLTSIRLNNYAAMKLASRVNINANRWYYPVYVTQQPGANPANNRPFILGADRFQMCEVHVVILGQDSAFGPNPIGYYDRVNSMRYEIYRCLVGLYERDPGVPETNSPTFARDAYIVNNNYTVERIANGTTSAPFYGITINVLSFNEFYGLPQYQKNAIMLDVRIGANLPRSEVQVFYRCIPYGPDLE